MKFPKLFEPAQIGTLRLKNRIVKAPQTTGLSHKDGTLSTRLVRHYTDLADGGAGLVIMEYAYVDDIASKSCHCQVGISNHEHIAWFDLVEIHAAHGYLITNFLSPFTNKRGDWYGGSRENHFRFLGQIVENFRRKTGPDYPLTVRLSGADYEPEGITIEDTVYYAQELERLGINAYHISGGDHHTMIHQVSPMSMPVCYNVWAAEAVKKSVKVPVIASVSITLPKYAEDIRHLIDYQVTQMKKLEIPADSVVVTVGLSAQHELYDTLAREAELEVYEIGDCVKAGKILDAFHKVAGRCKRKVS